MFLARRSVPLLSVGRTADVLRAASVLPLNCCDAVDRICANQRMPASVRCNSNRASIARVERGVYTRLYPNLLVQPDGSTINIRYKEPRRVMPLPFDITTLSEEEQKMRLAKRRPKSKIRVEEEVHVDFDASKYLSATRRKK